jgi:hypothetical protein
MKSAVLAMIAPLLGLFLSGCIIVDAHKESPGTTTAASSSAAAVCAPQDLATKEIDAASRLSHEPSRVEALTRIAQRQGLRPDSQARIVWAAYMHLSRDDSKVAVIRTVIDNPDFSPQAREAVLDGLNRHVSFDPSKSVLLEAVSKKG